jgi:hypothetical protein
MMMEEHHVSSLLAVYTRSAQIVEQSSSCSQWVRLCGMSPAFSFLLPRSSCKILWQAVLLICSFSDNIWMVWVWVYQGFGTSPPWGTKALKLAVCAPCPIKGAPKLYWSSGW